MTYVTTLILCVLMGSAFTATVKTGDALMSMFYFIGMCAFAVLNYLDRHL